MPPVAPAPTAIGPFTVERKLFTSGMSESWLVFDAARPELKLVLKRNLVDDNRVAWEELLRTEVEYLVRLRHPNVVRILPFRVHGVGAKGRVFLARESDQEAAPWFFVMEYITGGALACRLGCGFVPARKPGKLPWHTVAAKYALEYGFDQLEVHADAIKQGQRVLVHDDVLATGGTAKATAELVEQLGGTVVGMPFIIELTFLNGRDKLADYDVFSLIQYDS